MRRVLAAALLLAVFAAAPAAAHHAESSETGTHCTWTAGEAWHVENCYPCTVWIEAFGLWFWFENDHPTCRPQ